LQHLRRYRYDVANEGVLSVNPVHDEHSHCADAFRYLGVALRPPKEKKKLNLWSGEHDGTSAGLGWMR
jgi:phage terminase large subunit